MFTQELLPLHLKEGSSGELVCSVIGTPAPTIQWFHKNKLIHNIPDFMIENDLEKSQSKLMIKSLQPHHEGMFTCKAVNPFGFATSEAYLSVKSN